MKRKYITPTAESVTIKQNVILAAVSKTEKSANKGNGQLSKESNEDFDIWYDDEN